MGCLIPVLNIVLFIMAMFTLTWLIVNFPVVALVITIILILWFFWIIFIKAPQSKKQAELEKQLREDSIRHQAKKLGAPSCFRDICVLCRQGCGKLKNGTEYFVWTDAYETFNFLENNTRKIIDGTALFEKLNPNDFLYYRITGEEHYALDVHEEKRDLKMGELVAASSIGGYIGLAMVEKIIKGSVKTDVKHIDNRFTEIVLRKDNNYELCIFEKVTLYNVLQKIIPEKHIDFVRMQKMKMQVEGKEKQQSVADKFMELKQLLDNGLITQEEYNEKRARILDKI